MQRKICQVTFKFLFLSFGVIPAPTNAMDSQQEIFYDIDIINNINVLFERSDWDRTLDQLYADGEEERLVGTAVINGVRFDSVGVRYKGNSSYRPNQNKNPFRIPNYQSIQVKITLLCKFSNDTLSFYKQTHQKNQR